MISSLQDFKTYVDQACRAADEFVNIYYETMDKRRRVRRYFFYNSENCLVHFLHVFLTSLSLEST